MGRIIKRVLDPIGIFDKPEPTPAPIQKQTPVESKPAAEIDVETPETTPEVQEAARKERELSRRRRGRSRTVLTGPSGLPEESGKKTLLGA